MLNIIQDVLDAFRAPTDGAWSWVFRVLKWTSFLTLICTTVVYMGEYFSDKIKCINGFTEQTLHAIETYCFIHSTFTLVNFSTPVVGLGLAHGLRPDVLADPDLLHGRSEEQGPLTRHAYYQWVALVLSLQTLALRCTPYLWCGVVNQTRFTTIIRQITDEKRARQPGHAAYQKSVGYMASSIGQHKSYAIWMLLFEILGWCISLANLFFTNAFLGGSFFSYGGNAYSYIFSDPRDINNPINQVFPKITKCFWRKFGTSGTIETYDSLCVLPQNIVNEKTYLILWVVFSTSFALITTILVFRATLLALGPKIRNYFITRKIHNVDTMLLFNKIKSKLNYGDWFMLYQISFRMVAADYDAWVQEYAEEVMK